MPVIEAASAGCDRRLCALDKQTVFLRPHRPGEILDNAHGIAADALAHDPMAP